MYLAATKSGWSSPAKSRTDVKLNFLETKRIGKELRSRLSSPFQRFSARREGFLPRFILLFFSWACFQSWAGREDLVEEKGGIKEINLNGSTIILKMQLSGEPGSNPIRRDQTFPFSFMFLFLLALSLFLWLIKHRASAYSFNTPNIWLQFAGTLKLILR